MKTAEAVKIFLLGAIAALLLAVAINPGGQFSFAGTSAVSQKGGLIVVAGDTKSGNELLFVVDTVNNYVAQYGKQGNGQFVLYGARNFANDLRIQDNYNRNGVKVEKTKKLIKKSERDAKIGEVVAVAGVNGSFFLIDTTRKYMAQYRVDNSKRFLFQTARYIKNDLYIKDYAKNTGISVKEAKKRAKTDME